MRAVAANSGAAGRQRPGEAHTASAPLLVEDVSSDDEGSPAGSVHGTPGGDQQGAGACPAGAVTERVGRRVTDTQLEDEESGSKGRGGGGAAGGATLSAAVGHMGRLGMRRSVSFSDEHGRPLMEVFEIESLRRYTREGLSRKQLTLTLALAAGLITGFMIVMAAVVVASRR